MAKFAHHKYTYAKPWGSPRHQWELVGPEGGVHFHASLTPGYPVAAGLEFHRRIPRNKDEAPSQIKCWLLGCACWHDGTSLYASETLWPEFYVYLERGDHEAIFRSLEREYEHQFRCEPEDVQ